MPDIKVFDDLEHTLFDIIDAADSDGYSHFVRPKAYFPRDVSHRSKAALREVLECALQSHPLFVQRAQSWLDHIEASKTVLDNGDWLIRFNAVRFFLLPGISPAEELAELRSLFDAMKPHYVANAHSEQPGFIRVMNERDGKGRVYGSLKCMGAAPGADALGAQLQARINASPTLLHFQRQYGLRLGKVGRYSWCDLREENFFLSDEQPWKAAFYEKRAIERGWIKPKTAAESAQ